MMKTINFSQVRGTFNEYTCDQVSDVSGDFYRKEDVILYLEEKIAECEAAKPLASTPELMGIMNRISILHEIIVELRT